MRGFETLLATVLLLACGAVARGQDEFEKPPINYSRATPDNPISQLQTALEQQTIELRHEADFGYLRDVLKQLNIAPESQMLVFSKTSMQRDRISPTTPRAIYFNDEIYVGYCHRGEVLEFSVADEKLGTVFYTLDQQSVQTPVFARRTHDCLQCHGASRTGHVPGHFVRSLFVDSTGQPILSEGSKLVDHTTPFEDRWGGWYVTGKHGDQRHMGNLVIEDRAASTPWNNDAGQNVTDLGGRFAARHYLTPHSDLVALMVFEHQTHLHNLLTKANFTARQALHYEAEFNRALNEPADNRLESTTRRIKNAAENLVEGLLFVDEAPLTAPVTGSSEYARLFAEARLRDAQGRSLRDLDLTTRLFKHPCSYLIHSRQFDELHPEIKQEVVARLTDILAGGGGKKYAHLSPDDRTAIREILQQTKILSE